ncbi:MAG: hypothetical protein LBC59_05940 [Chitinispirillales bacterium]|nr:hypothetical protein [Chitinispirillales bacterium]
MAVKKASKKAAKKTYKSLAKKKTVPSLKRMTLEEYIAFRAEADAKLDALQAKTEASIDRLSAENRLLSAENRVLSAEVSATSEAVRQLSETVGGMGGHLGELIEFIVVPKIRPAINALGNHTFKDIMAKKIVCTVINDRKRKLTEMDVFLCGDTEAMAVEIKTCLQTSDVDKQLERLQKLRDHEVDAEIDGKTLFGAVVGAIVHDPVRTYALKKGLYVVEIREEEDKLDIDKPDACRTW